MKRIYFIFNILIIAAVTFFSENEDIAVNVKVPDNVEAGKSFIMEFTFVKKTKIETFARFLTLMPNGMTAEPLETKNALFTFKNREVKFLWLPGSLPQADTFKISYLVKVDTTVAGKVFIQGQFVYIKDNERKTFNLNPIAINVINNYGVLAKNYNQGDTTLLVESNSGNSLTSKTSVQNIITQTPAEGITRTIQMNGNVAIVTITVNKKGVGGSFAKIEEKLPPQFEAIADKDGGSVYTFTDNTAKFLWVNFPKDSIMTVSYKVMKNDASNISKDELKITGKFSYLQGTETIGLPINNAGEQTPVLAENQSSSGDQNNKSQNIKENNVSSKKNITENSEQNQEKNNVQTKPEVSPVFFRVQICALAKKQRSISFVKRIYRIHKKVYLEDHEGWRKYTAGNFKKYKGARDYRNYLWKRTPAKDAFVSAYNNGLRITVQEALMISNQKWIK